MSKPFLVSCYKKNSETPQQTKFFVEVVMQPGSTMESTVKAAKEEIKNFNPDDYEFLATEMEKTSLELARDSE